MLPQNLPTSLFYRNSRTWGVTHLPNVLLDQLAMTVSEGLGVLCVVLCSHLYQRTSKHNLVQELQGWICALHVKQM